MYVFVLDNDPPDIHFLPMGYMHLACTPEDADRLRENWKLQMYFVNLHLCCFERSIMK